MSKTKRFRTFQDFVEYNHDYIQGNLILNIFLMKSIYQVLHNPSILLDFFNILKDEKSIIVLLIKDVCLVYGDLEDDNAVLTLEKELHFDKFKRYTFAGNRSVLMKLLTNTNSKFNVVKHLSIFKCSQVRNIGEYDLSRIGLIHIDELDELYSLLRKFHSEFYQGYSEDILPTKSILTESISIGNYFKYEKDGQTIAIGSLKNDNGFPELSLIFTVKEERNKSAGTYLAHYMTSEALKSSKFIMLYTKGSNKPAKKVFEKIGYYNNGEYVMFYKEA